jgi:uncharacterized membrane protein
MKMSTPSLIGQMTTRSTAGIAHAVDAWEHTNPLMEKGALAKFNHRFALNELQVWANRSISYSALKKLLVCFAALCILVSSFSFLQGNVLAPIFMCVDFAIVALAIMAIARRAHARDTLSIEDAQLVVVRIERGAHTQIYQFPLGWLRFNLSQGDNETRIWLSASGQSAQFGSFLNIEQRASLALQVESFLDLAKARALSTL